MNRGLSSTTSKGFARCFLERNADSLPISTAWIELVQEPRVIKAEKKNSLMQVQCVAQIDTSNVVQPDHGEEPAPNTQFHRKHHHRSGSQREEQRGAGGGRHQRTLSRIHKVGTAGIVVQITGTNWPHQSYSIMVTGLCRFRIESLEETSNGLLGTVCQLDRLPGEHAALKEKSDEELTQLMDKFREHISKLVEMLELSGSSEVIRHPIVIKRILSSVPIESLPDICASVVKASHEEKLQILDAVNITERFRRTLPLLARQIEMLMLVKIEGREERKTCNELVRRGQENYQENIQKGRNNKDITWPVDINKIVLARKPIRRPDYDDLEDGDEIGVLEKRFRESELSEAAKKVVSKELRRLKKMPPMFQNMQSPVPPYDMYSCLRNYVELILELPWNKMTEEHLDLKKSRRDLDQDHFGMDKLKKRVLEYLAVRQLKTNLKAPILCFVGPPGVGKTSIGRSIAHSMGRKFHRYLLPSFLYPLFINHRLL
ncbi:LONP2 [Cordylochernes scorpioides]|uniref:LONP2 n=1 Tax=Cordylochernes scorpioides TaxID=51811 RepID=A0ABY6LAK1_9ARAC|nr:LONP2 [Cordylochernes scorpioides]